MPRGFLPKTFVRRPQPRHRLDPVEFSFPLYLYSLDYGVTWQGVARWVLENANITPEENDVEYWYDEVAGVIYFKFWVRLRPRPLLPVSVVLDRGSS